MKAFYNDFVVLNILPNVSDQFFIVDTDKCNEITILATGFTVRINASLNHNIINTTFKGVENEKIYQKISVYLEDPLLSPSKVIIVRKKFI